MGSTVGVVWPRLFEKFGDIILAMEFSPNPWSTPAAKSGATLNTTLHTKTTQRSRSVPKQRVAIRKISTLPRGDDLAFAGALPASPALLKERDTVVTYQHDMDPDELLLRLVDMHARCNDDEVAQRFEELEALRSGFPLPRNDRIVIRLSCVQESQARVSSHSAVTGQESGA
jgi:hypothetical protein